MPLLSIETNQEFADKQNDLLKTASRTVATMLGKPEQYVMVRLRHNPALLFAGSDKSTAIIELKSLGLPEQRTREFSQRLCALIEEELGISKDRIYIEFSSPARHMWGWDGGTF